ncbi:MAG: DUF4760 domain-containing protein, partial [Pseudomonadota bacterium]
SIFAASGEIAAITTFVRSLFPQAIWIAGVLIALLQFRHLQRSTVAENERKRREYALSYSLTRTSSHVEARQALTEVFGPTTPDSEILTLDRIDAAIEDDKTILSSIRTLLNHWENMSLAIHQGVADEDTAYEMVSQRVINTARQYQHYINRVHDQSPVSYKYLIWLTKRWTQRGSKQRRMTNLRLGDDARRKFLGVEY